jgi:hypothetical protein
MRRARSGESQKSVKIENPLRPPRKFNLTSLSPTTALEYKDGIINRKESRSSEGNGLKDTDTSFPSFSPVCLRLPSAD